MSRKPRAKPRAKPKTPTQIAAERLAQRGRDLAAVGLPMEAAVLQAHEEVQVTRAGAKHGDQTARHDTARRLDAFEALREGMPAGAYDAARRLELDILIRRGENDRGHGATRVDRTAGLTTDAMVQAAERLEAVLARLSPRDGTLLCELIAPLRPYDHWRDIVAFITEETMPHAQGALVRAVCVNLRDAYAILERRAA